MRSAAAKKMMEKYGAKPRGTSGSGLGTALQLGATALGAALGGPAGAQVGAGIGTELKKVVGTGEQAEEMKDESGMDAIMKGLEGLADADKKKKLLEMMKMGKITPEQATAAAKGLTAQ